MSLSAPSLRCTNTTSPGCASPALRSPKGGAGRRGRGGFERGVEHVEDGVGLALQVHEQLLATGIAGDQVGGGGLEGGGDPGQGGQRRDDQAALQLGDVATPQAGLLDEGVEGEVRLEAQLADAGTDLGRQRIGRLPMRRAAPISTGWHGAEASQTRSKEWFATANASS